MKYAPIASWFLLACSLLCLVDTISATPTRDASLNSDADDNVCDYFVTSPWELNMPRWRHTHVWSAYIGGKQGCTSNHADSPLWARTYYGQNEDVCKVGTAFICAKGGSNRADGYHWWMFARLEEHAVMQVVQIYECRKLRETDRQDNCDPGPGNGLGPDGWERRPIQSCCRYGKYYDVQPSGELKSQVEGELLLDPARPGVTYKVNRDMHKWWDREYQPRYNHEGPYFGSSG